MGSAVTNLFEAPVYNRGVKAFQISNHGSYIIDICVLLMPFTRKDSSLLSHHRSVPLGVAIDDLDLQYMSILVGVLLIVCFLSFPWTRLQL